jgi:hypothetical protein
MVANLRIRFLLPAGLVTILGCTSGPDSHSGPSIPVNTSKAAVGINVTAADPPFGNQGEASKQVRIFGSGFAPGDQAAWQRGGVTDPKIQVHSTQVVSNTELVATISIADDATLTFYDIAVLRPGRKGGIGTTLFEVTQAVPIASTEIGHGITDNGEVAGRLGPPGAFYFNGDTELVTLGAYGGANDISADGLTVAGGTGNCCEGAYVFERIGGSWVRTILSKGSSASANARAIGSDPGSGAALVVGGVRSDGSNKNLLRKPSLWFPGAGGWTLTALPTASTDDVVDDVTGAALAVGMANNRAAVWAPTGPGVWTLSLIGPSGSRARGVNSAGTIAVGEGPGTGNSLMARYWTRTGSSWNGPLALPGNCSGAVAVDDAGRILVNGCLNGSRRNPAVILPPYGPADIVFLGSLGDSRDQAVANDLSPSGLWITGQALLKNHGVAVRWNLGY